MATTRAVRMAKPAAQNVLDLGQNIEAVVDGDTLTLRIKLSERLGPSASGKTTIVATTSGNKPIGDTGVIIGLNAYIKR